MKRIARMSAGALILLTLPLAAWACGDGEDDGDDADDGAGNEGMVLVVAENTRFSPEAITVTSQQEVVLQLENRDAFEHDLQVDGLEVAVIAGGSERPEHGGEHDGDGGALAVHTPGDETASITFVADDPGTYEFYCTIPGHRESGMIGTLTVL